MLPPKGEGKGALAKARAKGKAKGKGLAVSLVDEEGAAVPVADAPVPPETTAPPSTSAGADSAASAAPAGVASLGDLASESAPVDDDDLVPFDVVGPSAAPLAAGGGAFVESEVLPDLQVSAFES